jgi:hypothetical protein
MGDDTGDTFSSTRVLFNSNWQKKPPPPEDTGSMNSVRGVKAISLPPALLLLSHGTLRYGLQYNRPRALRLLNIILISIWS